MPKKVAMEKLSYLTIACQDKKQTEFIASLLSTSYVRTKVSNDIFGTEYAAMLKNIYAIATGIAHGLGYGDNFQKCFDEQRHPRDETLHPKRT